MKPSAPTSTASLLVVLSALAAVQGVEVGCKQYDSWSGNGYHLINNLWGMAQASSGSQCLVLHSGGGGGGGVAWDTTWAWRGGDSDVKSYDYSGIDVSPKPVSQIRSLPTSASWSYNSTAGLNADVSYDLFTAADRNHATSSGDYELMIWLAKFGSISPIGGSPIVHKVNIAGHNWDLYSGGGSQHTYSFVACDGPLTSFSGDVMDFFTWLQHNQGYPASSQYLTTYQFGTEAFTGGPALFSVGHWSASVN
ncbi:hypothetical protein P8C59_004140 [Phyllachora maydis]|uniref:Uncharacterized protein n=1 Tax=Phyllachora maydis TaxID=1825666 RepID=A0AAD9I1T0_9PEZI|nr:hypothetical protein P8C59_004140 [Phyllachora maydis]